MSALPLLIPTDALAQTCNTNWADCARAFTAGTNDSAVSSTLKAWGPTDEVFVGIERRNPITLVHGFYLAGYECQNTDCSTYDFVYDELANPIGNELRCDRILQPGTSVTAVGGHRHLDIAMRTRADETAPSCGSATTDYANQACTGGPPLVDHLDLDHVQWNTAGLWNDEILR